MLSTLNRLLGRISVTENDKSVTIDGIPADRLTRDIFKQWKTSVINTYLFSVLEYAKLEFPKFFAIEVLYMLQQLIDQKTTRVNVRAFGVMIEQLKEHTWLVKTERKLSPILNYSKLDEITVPLKPHQRTFLETYDREVPRMGLFGYLLGAVPGSGKTLAGVALGLCLEVDIVVVISPLNAVYDVWETTLNTFLKKKPTYWIAASGKPIGPLPQYLIFHYETMDQALQLVPELRHKKILIILDESHNFNETSSQRTEKFVDFCRLTGCRNVVWASGTSIKALGSEMIPFLRTTDPLFTMDVELRFRKIFGKNTARANDIVANRFGMMSFLVKKTDIMGNIPPPDEHVIRVTIPNGALYTLDKIALDMREFISERLEYYRKNMALYRRDYDSCLDMHRQMLTTHEEKEEFAKYRADVNEIIRRYDPATMKQQVSYCNWYELTKIVPSLHPSWRERFRDVRSVIKYVDLKVRGECLGRVLGRKRAECNVAMIPYANLSDLIDGAVKKTIIFTSFVESVKAVVESLHSDGYKPVVIFGETNKDLPELTKSFREDPDANPIVATYKSLSTAVPLPQASAIILLNQPFREYERDQAISRANRMGQDTQVTVYSILLDTGLLPNISTRAQEIAEWSKKQVDEIMGTKSSDDVEVTLEGYQEPVMVLPATPKYMEW